MPQTRIREVPVPGPYPRAADGVPCAIDPRCGEHPARLFPRPTKAGGVAGRDKRPAVRNGRGVRKALLHMPDRVDGTDRARGGRAVRLQPATRRVAPRQLHDFGEARGRAQVNAVVHPRRKPLLHTCRDSRPLVGRSSGNVRVHLQSRFSHSAPVPKPNPPKPTFLFAHGAGAPSAHPWMRHWAELLGSAGRVVTFDYPYMAEGRSRPDPLPRLVEAHRAKLREVRSAHGDPVILIGKSMGGRVGCHLALEERVAAVVCLGYPLCGAGDRSKMRDAVLRELSTPILFAQGTRDALCPLDALEEVRKAMRAPNELFIVDGGDHSLMVSKGHLKRLNQTQDDVDRGILEAIRAFVARHAQNGWQPVKKR